MKNYLENAKKHFLTVTRHRHKVIVNCFRAGIGFQGLFHDLSKYGPTEFIPGIMYYQGDRSPNEREREIRGYSKAWLHHKGRNKHHYEHWNDYNAISKKIEGVEMPTRYFVEMVCDRIAASKIYYGENYTNKEPLNYYLGRKNKILINKNTAQELEKVLRMLAVYGEAKTFSYLRKKIRKSRNEKAQELTNYWIR